LPCIARARVALRVEGVKDPKTRKIGCKKNARNRAGICSGLIKKAILSYTLFKEMDYRCS